MDAGEQNKPNSAFSPPVIALVAVIASAFLITSYYRYFLKYCKPCLRRNTIRSQGDEEESRAVFQDSEAYRLTSNAQLLMGVDESIMKKIPIYRYRAEEELMDGISECAVCLAEFEEDESLRILPKCSHAFHILCIDMWFKSHANCPLCRADVLNNVIADGIGSNNNNNGDCNTIPSVVPIPDGGSSGVSGREIDPTNTGNVEERGGIGAGGPREGEVKIAMLEETEIHGHRHGDSAVVIARLCRSYSMGSCNSEHESADIPHSLLRWRSGGEWSGPRGRSSRPSLMSREGASSSSEAASPLFVKTFSSRLRSGDPEALLSPHRIEDDLLRRFNHGGITRWWEISVGHGLQAF